TDDAIELIVEKPGAERVAPGLDLGEVEIHAPARALPVQETGRERGRDETRRQRVGDRAVRPDRLPVGPACEPVEARQRRALAAEPWVVAMRAGLPLQAGAHHHQIGFDRRERVVAESEAAHRTRREVLYYRVG